MLRTEQWVTVTEAAATEVVPSVLSAADKSAAGADDISVAESSSSPARTGVRRIGSLLSADVAAVLAAVFSSLQSERM